MFENEKKDEKEERGWEKRREKNLISSPRKALKDFEMK